MSKYQFNKWDDYTLPPLEQNDYGFDWPEGTRQIAIELMCFKLCRMGHRQEDDEMLSCFEHFLNIVRMLFPSHVDIYKEHNGTIIWNNYFLDIASKLCEKEEETKKKQILTGPASANKTFVVALFAFICFVCAPSETMVLLSTTTGSASERRIWGDIKDFHRNAQFAACGMPIVGEIVDYQKLIVFDINKQVYDAKLNDRDIRNGISVIPIPTDGNGENALSTIQGSKNTFVIWVLDEMAQMNHGVTRPLRNLIPGNPHVHFVGIGNANEPTDPHGANCMPKGGFESLNYLVDREWRSATGYDVLFLSGDESPNYHPAVIQENIKKATDYPFSYATNRLGVDMVAEDAGNGDIEKGRDTVDYWKFCVGWWAPTTASSSLYTSNLFADHKATLPPDIIVSGNRVFAGGDFAFTVGGDDNTLMYATCGKTIAGEKEIQIPKDALSLKISATSKADFNKAVAKEFVSQLRKLGVNNSDFGGDTGNDAAITLNEMSREAKTHDFVGISSTGAAHNPQRYANRVTELWFQARDLIKTGLFRGINLQSEFVKQLCQRRYVQVRKDYYQIERKKDMKKRLGRSPDYADAFIYLCDMLIRSGLFDNELDAVRTIKDTQEEREEIEQLKRAPEDFRRLMGNTDEANDEYSFVDSNSSIEYADCF